MAFQPVGSFFNVSGAANGTNVNLAIAPNGDFVTVWQAGQLGSEDIYFRRYNANGIPKDNAPGVITNSLLGEFDPAVAMATDGSFVVTYGRWNPSVSKREVVFQRFDAAGNALGAPIETRSSASGGINSRNEYPDIAMFDNGDFVITSEGTGNTIVVESYSKDGTFKGNAFLGGGVYPTIDVTSSPTANGTSIVVAWEGNDAGNDDILFQRFDSNLNRLGSVTVADTVSKDNDKPSVALDAAGNFTISWTEIFDAATSDWDIHFRQFSANGVPLTSVSQLADGAPLIQDRSSVAMSNDGRFVIANEANDAPDRLREYSPTGTQVSSVQEFPGSQFGGTEVAISSSGKHMVLAFNNSNESKPAVWLFQTPNQTPTGINLSNTTVLENQAANTIIGNLTTVDADSSDSFIYSFVNGVGDTDNSAFSIVGNVLQVKQPLDFEAKSSYSIRVRTNDGKGGIFDKNFTITVGDVAELGDGTGGTGNPSTIQFAKATYGYIESEGVASIEVIRSGDLSSTSQVTVRTNTTGGTATFGQAADYFDPAPTSVLTFNPGETTKRWSVRLQQDGLIEPVETITFSLSSPSGATLGTQTTSQITIRDDDTAASITGGSANDTLRGTDQDNTLTGNAGNDLLTGFGGNDVLVGGIGNDSLQGGLGNDNLQGGDGNDVLFGTFGSDVLTGGAGSDQFLFAAGSRFSKASIGVATITDFTKGEDKIVISRKTFTAKRLTFASVRNVAQAKSSNATLTYVKKTGSLFYNQNGAKKGFGTGGLFTDLTNGLTLANSDISIAN